MQKSWWTEIYNFTNFSFLFLINIYKKIFHFFRSKFITNMVNLCANLVPISCNILAESPLIIKVASLWLNAKWCEWSFLTKPAMYSISLDVPSTLNFPMEWWLTIAKRFLFQTTVLTASKSLTTKVSTSDKLVEKVRKDARTFFAKYIPSTSP